MASRGARRRRHTPDAVGGLRAGLWWRLAAALAALAGAVIALVWPLAALARHLFVAHMAQHMLLIAAVAPLLLLSVPPALWALPRSARVVTGRLLVGGSAIRALWERLTSALPRTARPRYGRSPRPHAIPPRSITVAEFAAQTGGTGAST